MRLRLGVLDQSPIRAGGTEADALKESIRLAQYCEEFGFNRYWVAEHHSSKSFAGSSPEILITRIAAATHTIRVGSGGVMLPHYSPFKVAENFRMLETMFPDRIDLGVGRAPGSDVLTAQALAYGSKIGIEYFGNKVGDLNALIRNKAPVTAGLESVVATPRAETIPELWLLGSSEQSAVYAAHFGLPYSFAHFISPDQSQHCIDQYYRDFQPNENLSAAQANLGVFVACAETEHKAQELAACRDLWRLRFEQGDPGPYPSIEEALSYRYTDAERARLDERRKHLVTGTPETVKSRLLELAEAHRVNELVVVTICHDFEDRVNSYRLLSEAFDLKHNL